MPPPQASAKPPSAFHFAVRIGSAPYDADGSFREVSGIAAELALESVVEGGEKRFVHPLRKSARHLRLVLKRGVAPFDWRLVSWCREMLQGGLGQPITTDLLSVSLLDETGQPLRTWTLVNALPMKWEVEPFNAAKNEVAIGKVELSSLPSKREACDDGRCATRSWPQWMTRRSASRCCSTAPARCPAAPRRQCRYRHRWPSCRRSCATLSARLEFMRRLAALVPRPRLHLIRFHGVLAPHAQLRALVVRQEVPQSPGPDSPAQAAAPAEYEANCARHRPVRLSWAKLPKRVFDLDLEHCPNCAGELKIIAAILDQPVIDTSGQR